jgi:signal transduction histidine kinase
VLTIADNGPGIDAADRPLIFQKFSRRTRSSEGSGLGLAICRQILSAHGGSIRLAADAAPGGAVFEIELPLSHEAAAARPGLDVAVGE